MIGFIRRAALTLTTALACVSCIASTPSPTPPPSARPSDAPTFAPSSYIATIQSRGKVRIAIREDNAPFSAKTAAGRWEGFEADLAREIARGIFGASANLDQAIEWIPVLTATRQAALDDGRADLAVATVTITEDRTKQTDLSDAYFRTGQRILIKKTTTDINTPEELAIKTVCVARGSPAEGIIARRVPLARILALDTYASCLQALQRGQTDAITTDESILFGLALQDPTTKIVGMPMTDDAYAVAAKRDTGDRPGLIAFANTQLGAIARDGRWATLYRTWITPLTGEEKRSPEQR